MPTQGEVLVAIINNKRDFALLHQQHWYRIPVASARKWLKDSWPPKWVAFYQTKAFGDQAYSVRYYARVLQISKAFRWQLFGNEPESEKNNKLYYKLLLDEIQQRPLPILSRRWRRITFIPTTWSKFMNAAEINDLYGGSPLEDRLWAALKQREIPAERQEFVSVDQGNYFLDFAIYCDRGNLDIETDGDTWHNNPERAASDRLRDNALVAAGWTIQRFGTKEIREQLEAYCLPRVVKSIDRLGGIDEGKLLPRKIDLDAGDDDLYQPGLFDDRSSS